MKKKIFRFKGLSFFISIFLVLLSGGTIDAGEINIPLTVHEALKAGVSGIDREREPVTVGIPFPEGILFEKNGIPQLALEDVKEYQFRTLAKWPDGSVKWALIDFQTDVKAGKVQKKIRIVPGDGNSHGKLAINNGQIIQVNTGTMVVNIKKIGFNFFERVTINDKEILSNESKGIIVVDGKEREYLTSNDKDEKVVIEENGPVRAVIRAEGTHIGNGNRMMNYTVRMHFYKDKSIVRVFYTLRNASKEQVEHVYIRSLNLKIKIPISESDVQVVISKHNGTVKKTLTDKGDKIVYYQAVSDFPQVYDEPFYHHAPIPADYKRENERGFLQEGYTIKKNSEILVSGKRNEYPDLAFIDMADKDGKGVTVGIRFAAGLWPKSLRAKADGTIEAGLWPEENEAGYWIRYGSHNTFEMMFEFHATSNNPVASMKRFQYPLVAKTTVDWYNRNVKGVYPLYNFVSFADEKNYVGNKGWDYWVGWREPKMKIWRYHYWGTGGFLNQHDFARISLVNFLRETENVLKAGEFFLYSETRFNYNTDWAIFHSDDYDFSKFNKQPEDNKNKAELAKVIFEIEHMHWYGLPLYYYLTGDERIKESILDWGEIIKSRAQLNFILVYDRFFGWEMYSLAAMYDFTEDLTYLQMGEQIIQRLLSARFNEKNPWSNIFIDWNRGFVMRGDTYLKPGLMMGYIIFDGLYNYYLQMDDKNPLKERVADILEGISDFMYREPYFEGTKGSKNHWAFWLPYIYNTKDKNKSNHSYRLILESFYVNLAPYLLNGETKWLERMDKIIRSASWDEAGVWGGFGYVDHPGLQSILYQKLYPRRDDTSPQAVTDLSAELNGTNIVLKWTAPSDAIRYQIKFSNKKFVESLGFDPDKKAYEYDPQEYANWWAGENISDEPLPEKPGTRQTYTLKGLKPGHYYFAIRGWDSSNNRSKVSNLAEVEIK